MKTISERLIFFRENHLKITQSEFCEICNMIEKSSISQQNISQWENSEGQPNRRKMAVILKAFPELNRTWIEEGVGPMLIEKNIGPKIEEDEIELHPAYRRLQKKYLEALEKLNDLKK